MRPHWAGILLIAAIGCRDDSGTARKVSDEPRASPPIDWNAPEPPGGPPSCADVGQHFATGIGIPKDVHADVHGADFAVSGEVTKRGIEQGIGGVCRSDAWSRDARVCAMTWGGNILSERAGLRDACPGTIK